MFFYTQTQSLISRMCVFLVSVRHFVLQGHVGRNNLSLPSYKNKWTGNIEELNVKADYLLGFIRKTLKKINYHHKLPFVTYMTVIICHWFYALWAVTESLWHQSVSEKDSREIWIELARFSSAIVAVYQWYEQILWSHVTLVHRQTMSFVFTVLIERPLVAEMRFYE